MKLPRQARRLPTSKPWVGVNFWSRQGGPLMWRTYDDALVRSELQTLVDHGLNVTRSFCYWPDFHPAPDTIDEASVDRFRQFLVASAEIGIQTIPTFIVGHMSGSNWEPAWRAGRDLYRDGFMLGQQAFFIREVVRRIGDSPAVAAWLISNEMPWFTGPTEREYARAWSLICTDAVRAGGSDKPVSLGDGVWAQEVIGTDNGFRLRDQDDVVDFFGPHSYPFGSDPARQMHRAAFICELIDFGKPVVLEEFGVTDTFASEENAAHYYRQTLHQSLLAGATGWLGWNNTDFDMAGVEPYLSHPYELSFGVTRTDGTPKPALLELAAFRQVLDAVDATNLTRTDTRTAVLFPAHVDLDLPVVDLPHLADRELMPEIALHAWISAKAADLRPALVRESEGVPEVDLLLAGSSKALLATTFPTLLQRATSGAHVYVSWFAGVNRNQRGAWWPRLEPIFGARHTLRYGLSEIADDELTLRFTAPLGDLVPGDELVIRAAGDEYARAFLPLEVTDAEVIATDAHGRPALIRRSVGTGALYLGAYPVEYYGAARRNANDADQVHRLYGALAAEAGIVPDLRVADPRVFTDELRHSDGTRYTWIVNTSAEPLVVTPILTDGTQLVDVLTGENLTVSCSLPPFGVRVARRS
jgi:endo-1,4-beta-mannosidase